MVSTKPSESRKSQKNAVITDGQMMPTLSETQGRNKLNKVEKKSLKLHHDVFCIYFK